MSAPTGLTGPARGGGLEAVAEIARMRACGWAAFAQVFRPPTLEWVRALRAGEVRTELRAAVGWREGELSRFLPPLTALGAFARTAPRRSEDADLASCAQEYDALRRDVEELDLAGPFCELLAGLCRDEAAAWSTGTLDRGRRLRAHEASELREDGGQALSAATRGLVARAPAQPYLALGQLCREWLAVETGAEFVASVR
ncbi:MAG: hypothetical protein ACLGIA_05745 [Actinomycetes bacterium]